MKCGLQNIRAESNLNTLIIVIKLSTSDIGSPVCGSPVKKPVIIWKSSWLQLWIMIYRAMYWEFSRINLHKSFIGSLKYTTKFSCIELKQSYFLFNNSTTQRSFSRWKIKWILWWIVRWYAKEQSSMSESPRLQVFFQQKTRINVKYLYVLILAP